MNSKNTIWWVVGVIVIIAVVVVVMISKKDGGYFDDKGGLTSKDAALTANPEEVRQAELAYERAQAAYSKTRVKEGEKFVTIVNYTGARGFDPQIVSVNRGESVRFVNQSDESMRIVSNVFDGVPIYPGFNQEKTVGKGGTFSLSFSQPGVWGYHNLNAESSVVGVVYVK